MSGDGILRIGATVDKTGVDAGLASIKDGTQAVVQSIAVQVEETTAKTRAAWNKLNEDVKVAAQSVSAESLKVAEATREQAAAFADLRRAVVLTKDAKLDETQTNRILAAAQTRVAAVSAEVAAAKKEEAAAVARATEEEMLSENALVAAFQRAALGIRESLGEVQEKLVATAETGGLTAEGLSAGFSAFGALLGGGIAVGFAAHFIDELARANVELDHLHAKTSISIESLAGLQQILKEAGGNFETVATGLVRMSSNAEKLKQGDKTLELAFTNLGLKIEDVRKAKAEELLQMLATAFHNSGDQMVRANSAIAIFGRGGQELLPVLREQGAQLSANMKTQGALTGVTEKSATAARQWTQDVARLSAQFRSLMTPIMENAEVIVRRVAGTWEAAAAVLVSVFTAAATAIYSVLKPMGLVAKAVLDLASGNFKQAIADVQGTRDAFVGVWQEGFKQIRETWQAVYHTFKDRTQVPELPKGPDLTDTGGSIPKPHRGSFIKADVTALAQLKLNHQVTLDEEIKFWQSRLDTAKKGSERYNEIAEKLAPLMQKKFESTTKLEIGVQSPDMKQATADFMSSLELEGKRAGDVAKQLVDAYRGAAEEKQRIAEQNYAQVERDTEFEVQMGRMSPRERIAALRQAADQEEKIRLEQNAFLQLMDMGDLRRYQADLNQQVQIARQHALQIKQVNQQSALETARSWQQAYDRMSEAFSRNMSTWLTGQESLSQSWGRTLLGMTQTVIQNLLQQTVAYATHAASVEAIQEREKLKDAAAAARKTYVAVAAIPYVGPFLAPPAAAAAFAAVEAFELGGIVNGAHGAAVPILAHAGERVLTAGQTQNFERLVNNTSSASSHVENHYHDHTNLTGIDGASVEGMYRRHAAAARREFARQLRLANR